MNLVPRRPNPWKKGGLSQHKDKSAQSDIPCKMQQAYEDWKANGGVGTFSIMLVCRCPKCTLKGGTL